MGLPHPRPFYGENGSNGGLQVGINYGSAEATIMNPGGQSHQSLDQQLRQALETLQLLQLQFKEEEARRLIESSIFYVSFGKNDYINLFLGNSSGILRKYTGREFAQLLVDRMSQAMKILHDANVRKIICMGMLPLGCAPRVIWEWHNSTLLYDGSGCIGDVNELILQYNAMLEEHTVELNSKLPSAHIIFCDVYQGMMEIINNPGYYGFNDSKTACCGLGLLGASIGCLSVEMACNQSSGYVWWDLYNPTQALNSFLANSAWSGQIFPSVCRPIMIQDLVHIAV